MRPAVHINQVGAPRTRAPGAKRWTGTRGRAGGQAGGWGGLEGCIRGRGLADGREATMYPGPAAFISLISCVAQDSLSPGTLPMFGTRPFAAARGARTASALLCCRPWPRPR